MSTLTWIALAIGVLAILAFGFGLPDAWFCGISALACMLGAADAAYSEAASRAIGLLMLGVLLSGAALHAALRPGRERGRP